jgi:hypothetical protein
MENWINSRSVPKSVKTKVPCLVSWPGTKLNLVACEFRGNEGILAAGALLINSDVLMSACKFYNFRAGAVFVVS